MAASRTVLRAGTVALAIHIQESASDLSAGDVRTRLSDAIADAHRGTGQWAYYVDHFGDGESGDVIYSCDSDIMRAPYSISGGDTTAAKCVVDTDNAEDVVPRTVYEPEAEEDDHYAAMEEAFKRDKIYSGLPLYERFIAKSERDSADSSDFAGKGRSFPILKSGDVMAAVRSMGRAGSGNYSTDTLKRNIIRIAKKKGWGKYLPKSWQDGDAKESVGTTYDYELVTTGALKLTEAAATIEPIVLREARSDYEIKLIAPGKGSSAVYPAEVLKRDGPKVFRSGTHVYLNHPTAAEEAARPEGDVANLAGVLTTDAAYHESHAKGPGLYARMKVFADHAATVEEKAPHVGMSIRAAGVAEASSKSGELPVLKELTRAESVDVVTKAGAGGMILTEAARTAESQHQEASSMDAAELTKLQEAQQKLAADNARLLERALRGDAREAAESILKTTSLEKLAWPRVIEAVTSRAIPQKDGQLDLVVFTEAVNAAAKAEGAYVAALTGSGRVVGMGAAPPPEVDAKEAERKQIDAKQLRESRIRTWMDLKMSKEAAEKIVARDEEAA